MGIRLGNMAPPAEQEPSIEYPLSGALGLGLSAIYPVTRRG